MAEDQDVMTVDTALEDGGVPPESQEEESTSASPEEGRTTESIPSIEELQKTLAVERSEKEKAQKAIREMDRKRQIAENDNRKMRQNVLSSVEDQLKAINDRIDKAAADGEAITLAEIQRRDNLIVQKVQMQLNHRDMEDHQSRRMEAADRLESLAIEKLKMTPEEYGSFLNRHLAPTQDPLTGAQIMAPFGNYSDPEAAYNAAVAFLHFETRDKYQTEVLQTATQRADTLAKEKLKRALPNATSVKPTVPATPQDAYKQAIMSQGNSANPDSWF